MPLQVYLPASLEEKYYNKMRLSALENEWNLSL
jgi:hypothetical protein